MNALALEMYMLGDLISAGCDGTFASLGPPMVVAAFVLLYCTLLGRSH